MAKVIIAAGSNLGDRLGYLQKAGDFLTRLSSGPVLKSAVWESEPVGPAEFSFLNAVSAINTDLSPQALLSRLKQFEHSLGRDRNPGRWRPRILDLDIIAYNSLVIQTETLIIPHPEYHHRLFVLLPLQELQPDWSDPQEKTAIDILIGKAPEIHIQKTEFTW